MEQKEEKKQEIAVKEEITEDTLLFLVTHKYLQSNDFNGVPIRDIVSAFKIDQGTLKNLSIYLVENEKIDIVHDSNPHIKRFPERSREEQKDLLEAHFESICLYPSRKHLQSVMEDNSYQNVPYTRELALGNGQLEFRAFDLSILEDYRNDPRFIFSSNDVSGRICVNDDAFMDSNFPERDKVSIQTFGFCYDAQKNRAVAVFLRYLHALSPEHQLRWKGKEQSGEWRLHPDYERMSIGGEWGWIAMPICEAFIREIKLVNKMVELMGRELLFKNDNRSQDFALLLRPTLKEYNNFLILLDNLMSSNINPKFFKNDIDRLDENGKQKGTIKLLEEWVAKYYRLEDPEQEVFDIFKVFRSVRDKRSKPAHNNQENVFDTKFIHEQRELMIQAYNAVSCLRLIFSNHPNVRSSDIKIDKNLMEGSIWLE